MVRAASVLGFLAHKIGTPPLAYLACLHWGWADPCGVNQYLCHGNVDRKDALESTWGRRQAVRDLYPFIVLFLVSIVLFLLPHILSARNYVVEAIESEVSGPSKLSS